MTARRAVYAAPFVIAGTCDGRGYYLRERHGSYRVTIAADEDRGAESWTSEPEDRSIDIAQGPESDLCGADGRPSPAIALRVAVDAVRTALARNSCTHADASGGAFCPRCGVELAAARRWRWTEPIAHDEVNR
ncbi:MAG: hypothetical protein ACR2JF_07515 [Iamia sp.]